MRILHVDLSAPSSGPSPARPTCASRKARAGGPVGHPAAESGRIHTPVSARAPVGSVKRLRAAATGWPCPFRQTMPSAGGGGAPWPLRERAPRRSSKGAAGVERPSACVAGPTRSSPRASRVSPGGGRRPWAGPVFRDTVARPVTAIQNGEAGLEGNLERNG